MPHINVTKKQASVSDTADTFQPLKTDAWCSGKTTASIIPHPCGKSSIHHENLHTVVLLFLPDFHLQHLDNQLLCRTFSLRVAK